MNLLTITNEVLKIKNVSIKCVRILDIVPKAKEVANDALSVSEGQEEFIAETVVKM